MLTQLKFESNDNDKEYEIEAIYNYTVYAKKLETRHFLGLYYLISWKSYHEKENT